MSAKTIPLVASIALTAFQTLAETFFLVGERGASWQDVANWRIGTRTGEHASRLPGAGDYVNLDGNPNSTNAVDVSAADVQFIAEANLKAILINWCTLAFDVAEDTHVSCAIGGLTTYAITGAYRGTFIKRGAGALYLDSYLQYYYNASQSEDYIMGLLKIEEGDVYLQRDHGNENGYKTGPILGTVEVADGCAFHFPNMNEESASCGGFAGNGTIVATNLTATKYSMNLNVREYRVCDFGGQFISSDKTYLCVYMGLRQNLTAPSNRYSITYIPNGTVGFLHGAESRDAEQTLGTGAIDFAAEGAGSTLEYLGEGGDVLSKVLYCRSGNAGCLSGGANGGLVCNAGAYLWRYSTPSNTPGVGRFVFKGDGALENFYNAPIYNSPTAGSNEFDAHEPLTIVKQGLGTWNFGAVGRKNNGVVAVDEGTLRFGDIEPVGVQCSLGVGTRTYDPDYSCRTNTYDESRKVGYHIRIGGGETAGTLDYVGAKGAANETMVIAVYGDGTLKNSSASTFSQHGIVTHDATPSTLTLDVPENGGLLSVFNVTNSIGTLGVRKTGAGRARLDGRLAFNGELSVNAGELTVGHPPHYTWFRFTVKRNMNALTPNSFPQTIRLREFAFYDADGVRHGIGLVKSASKWSEMSEGEYAYDGGGELAANEGKGAQFLFDDRFNDSRGSEWQCWTPPPGLDMDDEKTWFRLVMRLSDNTPAISAFDYVPLHNGPKTKGGAVTNESGFVSGVDTWYVAEPRTYVLEGSHDGTTWTELYYEPDAHENRITKCDTWASSDGAEAFVSEAIRKGKGFAISSGISAGQKEAALENVTSISVAKDAHLSVLPSASVEVSAMKIDAADGVGRMDGVRFADRGTVEFTNFPDERLSFAIDWSNAENVEALSSWAVVIDGSQTAAYRISATATRFRCVRQGFTVTVR